MAVLKSCFCYSLRQGSFIIGSYALIVYCVAFAVELWWIVESLLILPAPAYTLCSLYFFNFIMAAVLLFGLLVRQRKYLMSWTLMTVLSFFPEAGMVLFMSLYYWPGHKYEYGVIELVYWSIRAMFNIFGAVCVCSLYLTWRDEELILGRLHDLTLANVEVESQSIGSVFLSGGGGGISGLSVLGRGQQSYLSGGGGGGGHLIGDNLTFAALKGNNNGFGAATLKSKSNNFAYHNQAYDISYPGAGGEVKNSPSLFHSRNGFMTGSRTHLNTISSQTHANNSNTALRASLLRMKSEFNPASLFDPATRKHRISELGIAGIGLEPPGQIPLHSNVPRSRSLWNISNEDYWSRPPPSRPVSMGYVNYAHQLDQLNNNYNNNYHHNSDLDRLYPYQLNTSKSNMLANMRSQSHTHLASSGGTLRNINPLGQVKNNNNNYGGSSLLMTRSGHGGGWDELRSFQHGRRAQSMDAINMNLLNASMNNNNTTASANIMNPTLFQQRYYGPNILVGGNPFLHNYHHHSRLQRGRQWSNSSLDDDDDDDNEIDDDDVRSYQDIPL